MRFKLLQNLVLRIDGEAGVAILREALELPPLDALHGQFLPRGSRDSELHLRKVSAAKIITEVVVLVKASLHVSLQASILHLVRISDPESEYREWLESRVVRLHRRIHDERDIIS